VPVIFEDETGQLLWEQPNGQYQPPGTMVTDYDGKQFVVVRVRTARAYHGKTVYRMRLRPLR
jgi:hypothetical protein